MRGESRHLGATPMSNSPHVLYLSVLLGSLPLASDADPPTDSPATPKAAVTKPTEAPAEWTETRIASRIRKAEESKDLKPEDKLKVLELYKSAQNGFKKAEEWTARSESMERLTASAPEDAKKLRQEAKTTSGMDPMAGVQDRSLKGLEAQFKQAKTRLEEAEKAVADSEAEPARRTDRRRKLPELRQTAQKKLQEQAKKPQTLQQGEIEEMLTSRKAIQFAYSKSLRAEVDSYTKELAYLDATNDLV